MDSQLHIIDSVIRVGEINTQHESNFAIETFHNKYLKQIRKEKNQENF